MQKDINKLLGIVSIEGHKTNHSLRRTQATSLFQVGRTGEEVKERTGHKSSAVEAYMQTSNEQKREISAVLAAVAQGAKPSLVANVLNQQNNTNNTQHVTINSPLPHRFWFLYLAEWPQVVHASVCNTSYVVLQCIRQDELVL